MYNYRQTKILFKNAVKENKNLLRKGKIHRIIRRRGEWEESGKDGEESKES